MVEPVRHHHIRGGGARKVLDCETAVRFGLRARRDGQPRYGTPTVLPEPLSLNTNNHPIAPRITGPARFPLPF